MTARLLHSTLRGWTRGPGPVMAALWLAGGGPLGCATPLPAGGGTTTVPAAPSPSATAPGGVREQDVEASGETPTSVVRQVDVRVETRVVSLAAGHVVVDLYFRNQAEAAPLVVVAHGFWRSRANMAGWGRHLAAHGFVAAVPDLPAWSDHARNGRAINELIAWLIAHASDDAPVDRARIAVVGFSAGGLATLLAASDNPSINLWIGLDPVDRRSIGEAAAARLRSDAVIITAEPSSCNAHGNAQAIARALGERVTVIHVPGATHADAEWPSDWKARLVCGGTSPERQASFVRHATAALESKLAWPGP